MDDGASVGGVQLKATAQFGQKILGETETSKKQRNGGVRIKAAIKKSQARLAGEISPSTSKSIAKDNGKVKRIDFDLSQSNQTESNKTEEQSLSHI